MAIREMASASVDCNWGLRVLKLLAMDVVCSWVESDSEAENLKFSPLGMVEAHLLMIASSVDWIQGFAKANCFKGVI